MAKERRYSARSHPAKARPGRDYSTGQAAALVRLSIHTIIRCVDSGRLKGYRVPGSKFRRIPAAALRAFVEAHGLTMPPELAVPDLTAGVLP